MNTLSIKKIVEIPQTLTPNTLYLLKRAGTNRVTVYFTDATALELMPMENGEGFTGTSDYVITDSAPVLTPLNADMQRWILTNNSTPTIGEWPNNAVLVLAVEDGDGFFIDWSQVTATWRTPTGNPPPLNTEGYTFIRFLMVDGSLYGFAMDGG